MGAENAQMKVPKKVPKRMDTGVVTKVSFSAFAWSPKEQEDTGLSLT